MLPVRRKSSLFGGKASLFGGKGSLFEGKGSLFEGKASQFEGKASQFGGTGTLFQLFPVVFFNPHCDGIIDRAKKSSGLGLSPFRLLFNQSEVMTFCSRRFLPWAWLALIGAP